MIRVALFSGGRGSATIVEGLARSRSVSLTVLVNAYDDGLSTGRIRNTLGDMLGPSDIRKNYARLLDLEDSPPCRALATLLEHRIEIARWTPDELSATLHCFQQGDRLPTAIAALRSRISVRAMEEFALALATFARDYGDRFDFDDCALGNAVIAGFFLLENRDFNRAIERLQKMEPLRHHVVNVTRGEPLRLCAVAENDEWIPDEASLVADRGASASRIREFFLVPMDSPLELSPKEAAAAEIFPDISVEAKSALEGAHAILYAPGTQHSSLLPSYVTRGVGEAISANIQAKKIFVFNLGRDHDLVGETASGLFEKFFRSFNRKGQEDFTPSDVLTEVFAPLEQGGVFPGNAEFPWETEASDRIREMGIAVVRHPYGSERGRHHLPGQVANAVIERVVQHPLPVAYSYHLLSIIIPVLDEGSRIGHVLRELSSAAWPPGLRYEILFMDGGSRDSTVAEIEGQTDGRPEYRILRCPRGTRRGAAIRKGIEAAKGDIIAVFHGDREYAVSDLLKVIDPVKDHGVFAAIGSRVAYQPDVRKRLASVYQNESWMSRFSQFGGLVLGLCILLLFQRPISDPLTGIKVFNGNWLRRQAFTRTGVAWDVEVLLAILRQKKILIEIPILYSPRSVAEGKKTRLIDGLFCLLSIITERFRKATTA